MSAFVAVVSRKTWIGRGGRCFPGDKGERCTLQPTPLIPFAAFISLWRPLAFACGAAQGDAHALRAHERSGEGPRWTGLTPSQW
ncbi:hypothetical protein [Paenibacillus guangzhouensis]|uniref:hypothetical protein n=1 Tax=Paenibacillus guangzhouensis TaxID=1473112 RepID=UPI00187B1166|nr:hypothetical protein [Paenibacillus guangzhouensis]